MSTGLPYTSPNDKDTFPIDSDVLLLLSLIRRCISKKNLIEIALFQINLIKSALHHKQMRVSMPAMGAWLPAMGAWLLDVAFQSFMH